MSVMATMTVSIRPSLMSLVRASIESGKLTAAMRSPSTGLKHLTFAALNLSGFTLKNLVFSRLFTNYGS
ncbi:unannotated protein [freshwater metagenome]|uniref:Unannotated protein n=1 Tax=freshwater metagenome TaxID=449393 RepID=A0A6J6L4Q5_9ZZZZ